MYTLRMGRKDFVSWLGDRVGLSIKASLTKSDVFDVRAGEILLVWNKKPTVKLLESPLLIVPDSDLVDFFAFVSTYVGSYKPFSAFFNVLGLGVARRILSKSQGLPDETLSKLTAVVIAEVFVQMGGKPNISDISVSACFGTFSDSVIQLTCFDDQGDAVDEVADRWLEARELLAGDVLPLSVDDLVIFWKLLLDGIGYADGNYSLLQEPSGRGIVEFLNSILSGNSGATEWESITEKLPLSRIALRAMEGSREGRVKAFDDAVSELAKAGSYNNNSLSLIVGYLASKVGGGSMQYLSLAYDLSPNLKLAPLWFALFSAFTPGSDYISIGDSLGRRLTRERVGRKDFWGDSDSDISLEELRVVAIDEGGVPRVRRLRKSTIDVEIYPKVSAAFRIGRRKVADEFETVLKNRNQEIRYLLDKISGLLDPKDERDFRNVKVKENYTVGRKGGRQREF